MIFIYDYISYECKCKNKIDGFIEKIKKSDKEYWISNNLDVFLKVKIPVNVYKKILEDYKKNDDFEFKLFRDLNDQISIFKEENSRYYKIKAFINRSTVCSSYNENLISVNFELCIIWYKQFDKIETRDFILNNLFKNEKQE